MASRFNDAQSTVLTAQVEHPRDKRDNPCKLRGSWCVQHSNSLVPCLLLQGKSMLHTQLLSGSGTSSSPPWLQQIDGRNSHSARAAQCARVPGCAVEQTQWYSTALATAAAARRSPRSSVDAPPAVSTASAQPCYQATLNCGAAFRGSQARAKRRAGLARVACGRRQCPWRGRGWKGHWKRERTPRTTKGRASKCRE